MLHHSRAVIRPTRILHFGAAGAVLALLLTGCAAGRGASDAGPTGFLGDVSRLQTKHRYPNALVYVDPGAQWVTYKAVDLDYVGLWLANRSASVSPADRQMLTEMLYTSLHDALARYFTLADHPGPEILLLRVALTEAPGAGVTERATTRQMPALRLPVAKTPLDSDTAAAIGAARIEMEVRDAATDARLAAAVDQRSGTEVFFPRHALHTWGDVEAACDYWSNRIAWRLAEAGVQLIPDAKSPENVD